MVVETRMGGIMRLLIRLPVPSLQWPSGFAPTVQATATSPQGVSVELVQEWTKFPKPPKQLTGDPTTSAVLLMDFDLKGELGNSRVDGAGLVRVGDSEPILAAPIKGDLVMFLAIPREKRRPWPSSWTGTRAPRGYP